MNVLVTGSTGLVGSELVSSLTAGGHVVTRLVRPGSQTSGKSVTWDPQAARIDKAELEGFDGVVHLAGENIASGRWTEEKKKNIRDSRIEGTRLLSSALAQLQRRPRVLVSASAIGYYGSRGDEKLTESSAPETGFLADVCKDWEAATEPAAAAGIRVVLLRIGVILNPKGGALSQMLFPFRMGVGGRIGSGQQFFSWVTLDDIVGAINHALKTENLKGPVNGVSPNPVTNLEFTKTLGRVLGRPTILPMPAFAARLALGEMADELLLSSQRVEPKRLTESNYTFRFPELEPALRHMLTK